MFLQSYTRNFKLRRSLLGASLIALSGCAVLRPAVVPMEQITDLLPGAAARPGQRPLVVFLPGAYDEPQDFVRFGFIEALRSRNLAADAIAIDSHYGYFKDYSIAERMRDDVIAPARAKGYERIWLVGISLGGLGSLLTAERYPGVSGIVALAPFIASPQAIAEVRLAGGLRRWQADSSTVANGWEKRLLSWLSKYDAAAAGSHDATAAGSPRLVLGFGRQDRFADSLSEIAKVLDPTRVLTQDGGHDWDTWKSLWLRSLDLLAGDLVG
jgi:pimeloyl-ACP methyl ester carboxylesterase